MKLAKSPLAPATFPDLFPIEGVSIWTRATGMKYKGRDDVLVCRLSKHTAVAGVFTRSHTPGAPIIWSKMVLEHQCSKTQPSSVGIIVNAGNANVFTGAAGLADAKSMAKAVADVLGLDRKDVFVASTGVIGEPLDTAPICKAVKTINPSEAVCDFQDAANAIRTTDTFAKGAKAAADVGGKTVQISGIVKGSGMIAPNMATMLGFIFTDAAISQSVLQTWIGEFCETSFNAITVDSDTSTSDMVLACATGRADHTPITDPNDPEAAALKAAIHGVMVALAKDVVKDGEGAQKFISVRVAGAKTTQEAKTIAFSIANSPLVKTAIAGEDANWGRVVMAVGKTDVDVDYKNLHIQFGPHCVAKGGARAADYNEDVLSTYMQSPEIDIQVELGLGAKSFTVWTCDFTHGYIDINADYRS